MKKNRINKAIIFGIILVFTVINIVPAETNIIQNKTENLYKVGILAEKQNYYNLIGGVNVTFDFITNPTALEIEWWYAEDRNFTYPIDSDGNVEINYTLKFQTYSKGIFIIPRLSTCYTSLYYPIDRIIGFNSVRDLVTFTQFYPGFEEYLVVKSIKMPKPDSDPGSDNTSFATWNYVAPLIIPPIPIDDSSRIPRFIHYDPQPIPFWATFYYPD